VSQDYCKITALDLSENKIGPEGTKFLSTALQSENCKITNLNLSDNKIDDSLADSFERLFRFNATLLKLDLSDNLITSVPIAAVKAYRPEIELNLKGNPAITFPPRHIAEAGPAEVRRFFVDLQEGCVPVSLVNVLLVGNGGVGKTTLKMKALLGQEPLSAGTS